MIQREILFVTTTMAKSCKIWSFNAGIFRKYRLDNWNVKYSMEAQVRFSKVLLNYLDNRDDKKR